LRVGRNKLGNSTNHVDNDEILISAAKNNVATKRISEIFIADFKDYM
jgi:hypothetical protein